MTRSLRSAWHRRRIAVLLATATIGASFGWALAPDSSSAQTADPPFTVEVSQTSGLLDGDVVEVTVRANPGARLGTDHFMQICRSGVVYDARADTFGNAGNCPTRAVSTSSEAGSEMYTVADGSRAEGDITVGTGVGEWDGYVENVGPTVFTLECGAAVPCTLLVRVSGSVNGGPFADHFVSVDLTFGSGDPTAGCGSQISGAISSAGSDRLQGQWVDWTLEQCGEVGGVSTSFAPTGEGEGLNAFTSGARDLAFTAAGDRPVAGLQPAQQRSAVYTPVAVNAVVVAAIGGELTSADPTWPVGMPRPYGQPVRLKAGEVATLLGRGQFTLEQAYGTDVRARNPQLGSEIYFRGSEKYTNPLAVQDSTAVSLFMTSFLDARAPDEWIAGNDAGGGARGVHARLGDADPSFASALQPISSKSQVAAVRNLYVKQTIAYPGPGWVLTDYATAVDLGLTPVAIENAAGEFVLPTRDSIAAGVATMTVEADGRRTPDPGATALGAYPLTMIEYAMAPAEPLVDAACAPRAESQQVLSSWLSFLTGPGQAALGNGLVPLTADLVAEAEASITRVGALPSTAACTPTNPTRPTTAGPAGPAAGGTSTGASGTGGSGAGVTGSGSGAGAGVDAGALSPSTPAELAGAAELADAAEPTLPPFLGIAAVSELISPVALLLVVVLTSGAAFVTSGRPAPPAVASGARRLRAGAGRAVRRIPLPRRG